MQLHLVAVFCGVAVLWCFDVSAFLVNSFGVLGLVLVGLAEVSLSWSVRTVGGGVSFSGDWF